MLDFFERDPALVASSCAVGDIITVEEKGKLIKMEIAEIAKGRPSDIWTLKYQDASGKINEIEKFASYLRYSIPVKEPATPTPVSRL